MATRREFIGGGFGAVGGFLLGMPGRGRLDKAPACHPTGAVPLGASHPVRPLPPQPDSVMVDGLPYSDWFTGDDFTVDTIEFHHRTPIGKPPTPTEEVDVAVVGGGISGLASAYLLRKYRPVVLELHSRFGGSAQGETWRDIPMALGSAYVITPDPGSFLGQFYRKLGLHRARRESWPPDPIEIKGTIEENFWDPERWSGPDRTALQRYAEVVAFMADEGYPEIPVPDGKAGEWVRGLDLIPFRRDIENRMGVPMPSLLAAAVQAYCYSSFGAGMDELSAAAGWNFLAAEEYGRWVFPGGNSYMARQMWKKLRRMERHVPPNCPPQYLRGNCTVLDVRLRKNRVQVTYLDGERKLHSLLAKRVVMACPKHICKYVIHDLANLDADKFNAMNQIHTTAYVVANVLLNAPIRRDFYDIFMVGDETFPMMPHQVAERSEVIDMLSGDYAAEPSSRSVLTLYWPLSWASSRFRLLPDEAWQAYAESLAPQVRRMLDLLDVPETAIQQIRMTRWGHAMPVPVPGFITNGLADSVQRPVDERIYFVNQDNWALPAIENCLLDADTMTKRLARGL